MHPLHPCYSLSDMTDYRVNLDNYDGPLDLLLYLIRRDEIDIYNIPIARITAQYCAYADTLRQIDPNVAGDFLVMATILMEIKTRMLLPRQEVAEDGEEAFDPRAELVRQLLEYKAFKDAAGELREAAAMQAMRFPRRPAEIEAEEPGMDLEEVQVWDLVDAFNQVMASIGQNVREAAVIYDDTPIELHAEDILHRLRNEGNMTFREVFAGRTSRGEVVGLFLALLELARRRAVYLEQDRAFEEVRIFLNPNPPADADAPEQGTYAGEPADTEVDHERGSETPADAP